MARDVYPRRIACDSTSQGARIRAGIVSEMYSWAGEHRFGDRDLFELARDGALSTGSFSSMLASISGSDAARFAYNGDSKLGGRLLSEFGFLIPQERSRYMYVLGSGPSREVPTDDGTAFVNPGTSDLVRSIVRTGQVPAETGACELSQVLEYGPVRIKGREFGFPRIVLDDRR